MEQLDLTDHLLIAMPTLLDPNFHQTVSYICAHNEEGAMGIVINRPMDLDLGDVLVQMDMASPHANVNQTMVFQGGPVHPDRGFVIHRPGSHWESTIAVTDQISVSTSRDVLQAIADGNGPTDTLIALGYAGWGGGQLERELAENAWLSVPTDLDVLFHIDPEHRWRSAASILGVDVANLSPQAGHA